MPDFGDIDFGDGHDLPEWELPEDGELGEIPDSIRDAVKAELGLEDVFDILVGLEDQDIVGLRSNRFSSMDDALTYLKEGGILSFFMVAYLVGEDLYGIIEIDTTP